MFREMFPDCTMYEILAGEWFSTRDGMAGQRRFTAFIRGRRENGNRAFSQSFRGDTYPNALHSLWRGISDVYHTWLDFPGEEGEAARLSFMQRY
ncbi:hypothetical protein BFW01_g11621 [Lasiodiplodia theobromae]|nr:hypothetical protein BFW01_g11621 [Lasiodiplodia theobromae]